MDEHSFEVTEVGMSTEVGKIAGLLKNGIRETEHRFKKNLDDFGKKLSITILVFCEFICNQRDPRESIVNAFYLR